VLRGSHKGVDRGMTKVDTIGRLAEHQVLIIRHTLPSSTKQVSRPVA
jgi:hypothetical protein